MFKVTLEIKFAHGGIGYSTMHVKTEDEDIARVTALKSILQLASESPTMALSSTPLSDKANMVIAGNVIYGASIHKAVEVATISETIYAEAERWIGEIDRECLTVN